MKSPTITLNFFDRSVFVWLCRVLFCFGWGILFNEKQGPIEAGTGKCKLEA